MSVNKKAKAKKRSAPVPSGPPTPPPDDPLRRHQAAEDETPDAAKAAKRLKAFEQLKKMKP